MRFSWPLLLLTLALAVLQTGVTRAGEGEYDSTLGERILSFDSAIEVFADSSMEVTETITVQALGINIRRGIYRDFPTRYRDKNGHPFDVGFEVVGVKREGQPEPYFTERQTNGWRVYIGDEDYFLPWGTYTYELTYRTNRQLGFFTAFDELYWNVTGNGWDFPIDSASATVTLPASLDQDELVLEAYTGYQGAQEQYYDAEVTPDGRALFSTTEPLNSRQGLTIVVRFPKGVVTQPTKAEMLALWRQEHNGEFWALIGLVVLLAYYVVAWVLVGIDPLSEGIKVTTEPPAGMSPAAIRFVRNMGSDTATFTAALTNMAVKGNLLIEEDAGGNYILKKTDAATDNLTPEESAAYTTLFEGRSELLVDQDNHSILSAVQSALRRSLNQQYAGTYFARNTGWVSIGILLTIATGALLARNSYEPMVLVVLAVIVLVPMILGISAAANMAGGLSAFKVANTPGGWIAGCVIAFIVTVFTIVPLGVVFFLFSPLAALVLLGLGVVNSIFVPLMPRYTRRGRRLLDEAEGFKRMLAGQLPELPVEQLLKGSDQNRYLAFLPFVIALGISRQWGRQLERVFAGMQERPVQPDWYRTPYEENPTLFRHERFVNDLAGSFTSTISSSSVAPGSSSGGGGGGSSGGGGGGGGGGGW
ncbi:DUF2207 domain-containing protein [bacterium]|nr:DUF2207 domain-containing protein [bacterium]